MNNLVMLNSLGHGAVRGDCSSGWVMLWLIGLEQIGAMVMKMVGACHDLWRDTMREKADMSKEGRAWVMVALITHHHKPSFTEINRSESHSSFYLSSLCLPSPLSFFIIPGSIWQISIRLSTRPCEIPATPERRVRIVRVDQSFDGPLRTGGADTFSAASDGVGLGECNVSMLF